MRPDLVKAVPLRSARGGRRTPHPPDKNPARKLGRRPGDADTAARILDVAEEEFAAHGYDGTSLRAITDRADVNQALIRYYFASKDGLYTAIFLRRGRALAAKRIRLLSELEARSDRFPTLEEIVTAFLTPAMDLAKEGAGGVAYMRLLARLQNETDGLSRELRREVYEESTQHYIKALQRAVPDVDPTVMYWRMVFLVGAYFYTISGTNRLDVISGGRCRSTDLDESMRQLVSFLVGGLRAPLLRDVRSKRPPRAKSGIVPTVRIRGEKR